MKINILIFIALSSFLSASTVSQPEATAVGLLAADMHVYSMTHDGNTPSTWEEYAKYFGSIERLNSNLPDGENFTELYSFIPESERSKFPLGQLLLLRHASKPWPNDNEEDSVDTQALSREQLEDYKKYQGRQKPIRYLIYRDNNGLTDSVWWYEKDVQDMLAETGIRVPEPDPYHASPVKVSQSSSLVAKTSPKPSAVKAPIREPAEVKPVEVAVETPEQSSQWWLWLVGALVVLGGLAVVLRRKS